MKRSIVIAGAALAVAASVALVGLAVDRTHNQAISRSLTTATIPISQLSPIEHQRDLVGSALRQLEANAAPYDRANFGPNTFSIGYRSAHIVSQAYSRTNGTLFVVLTALAPGGAETEVDTLATLNRGRFSVLPLPKLRTGGPGYAAMSLREGSVGDNPILRASDYNGNDYYFVATPRGVSPVGGRSDGPLDVYTLSTGEECSANANPKSPVAVWAVNKEGRRRPFITYTELFQSSHGLLDGDVLEFNDVNCFHLGGLNLLNIGDRSSGVVFGQLNGRLVLLTRGQVLTSGARHILIMHDVKPGYADYLEVFAR